MVNKANKIRDSTNIRIKIVTKKKLEAEAIVYKETHNDIIERLIFKKRTGKDQEDTAFEKKIEDLI